MTEQIEAFKKLLNESGDRMDRDVHDALCRQFSEVTKSHKKKLYYYEIAPTDEQILECGKQWKKALGIDPYRMFADADFAAGATWIRDMLKDELPYVKLKQEITRILYQNSNDDSECMRIKFENIQKVLEELSNAHLSVVNKKEINEEA